MVNSLNTTILFSYLSKEANSSEDGFIEYCAKELFMIYLRATLKGTRKKHISNIVKQQNTEITYEYNDAIELSSNDEYTIVFASMIKLLPLNQQNYVILRYFHCYSHTVVADMLGLTKQAANGLRNRALNSLRKELGDDLY